MDNPHSAQFIAEMKTKLEEYKAKLSEELSGLHPHTEIGDDLDEAASELVEDEVNQDLIAQISADFAKIDAALGRVDEGTYGVDADGKVISEDRLRALPWAEKAL